MWGSNFHIFNGYESYYNIQSELIKILNIVFIKINITITVNDKIFLKRSIYKKKHYNLEPELKITDKGDIDRS